VVRNWSSSKIADIFRLLKRRGFFSIQLKNFLTGYEIVQIGMKKTVSIFIEFYYFAQHSVEMIE
jgi:hypothetical protein